MGSDVSGLFERALSGDRRAISKIISILDNYSEGSDHIIKSVGLLAKENNSHVIGVTGAAGVGKSTLVAQMANLYSQNNKKVAILAVDPNSPFSGGAILGDRIRMGQVAANENVFIRSLSNRGRSGGISYTTAQIIKFISVIGFDWVIVETVGAGQSEIEIMNFADTIILVLVPGLGDSIQTIKAGILEIADIFVVNKADNNESNRVIADLEMLLKLKPDSMGWKQPICKTIATEREGISLLVNSINEHYLYLKGKGKSNRSRQAKAEVKLLIEQNLNELFESFDGEFWLKQAEELSKGKIQPLKLLEKLLINALRYD